MPSGVLRATATRTFAQKAALFLAIGWAAPTPAQTQNVSPAFEREREFYEFYGELPRRGDLDDILRCAASNEVFWVEASRTSPGDAEAHEARLKAGWYAAVALWVFAVDPEVVTDSVAAAARQPKAPVIALARNCRKAPDNWRE